MVRSQAKWILDCGGRAQRRHRLRADAGPGMFDPLRECESGVAADLTPQSKTVALAPRFSAPVDLCVHPAVLQPDCRGLRDFKDDKNFNADAAH